MQKRLPALQMLFCHDMLCNVMKDSTDSTICGDVLTRKKIATWR